MNKYPPIAMVCCAMLMRTAMVFAQASGHLAGEALPQNAGRSAQEIIEAESAEVDAPDAASPTDEHDSQFEETAPPVIDTTFPLGGPPRKEPAEAPDFFKAHQRIWDDEGAAAPETEAAAPPMEPPSLSHFIPRMIIGLCIVCGLILLGGCLARRMGRHSPLLAGPRLGAVLGRVHLAPKVTLHYVRTGGRVLVVAVTPNAVSLVADFPGDQFEATAPEEASDAAAQADARPASFLQQLQAIARQGASPENEDDLAALRSDLQRLQRYLQEGSGEPRQ